VQNVLCAFARVCRRLPWHDNANSGVQGLVAAAATKIEKLIAAPSQDLVSLNTFTSVTASVETAILLDIAS